MRICFRLSINNILKHAHAEYVEIHLREENDTLILEIRDDGRGLDLAAAHDMGGI